VGHLPLTNYRRCALAAVSLAIAPLLTAQALKQRAVASGHDAGGRLL
jgi:hypothetical protein